MTAPNARPPSHSGGPDPTVEEGIGARIVKPCDLLEDFVDEVVIDILERRRRHDQPRVHDERLLTDSGAAGEALPPARQGDPEQSPADAIGGAATI
jgi:hypothetical protein